MAMASEAASAAGSRTVVDVFMQRAAMTPHRDAYFVLTAGGQW
jgi:hypothetical protein